MVEGYSKASNSIATILPLIRILQCWVLSEEVSSTIFWVFGVTLPAIGEHSDHFILLT